MDTSASIALRHVACALCGHDDAAPELTGQDWLHNLGGEFTVVRCRHCGLVYQNPQPTIDATSLLYPSGYAPHETPSEPQPVRTLSKRMIRALLDQRYGYAPTRSPLLGAMLLPFDWFYSTINFALIPFHQKGRLLDVGCGSGGYLLSMRRLGWQVAGVEISSAAARMACDSFGLDVFEGDLLDAPLPEASFDVVTMWWYLEHTHNPLEVLSKARRLLRPGGLLALGVPNWDSAERRLFGRAWYHLDLPRHFTLFGRATLRAMLARAGFGQLRLRTGSWLDDPAYSVERWNQIRTGRSTRLPKLARRLLMPSAWMAARVQYGPLLLAHARKPDESSA